MSCLTQALLPISKLTNLTFELLDDPESYGGWEMGTWDYRDCIEVFQRFIPKMTIDWGIRRGGAYDPRYFSDHCRSSEPGYWEAHVFSLDECEKIAKGLSRMKTVIKRGKKTVKYGDTYQYLKYHKKLIELFKSGEPVVWYAV